MVVRLNVLTRKGLVCKHSSKFHLMGLSTKQISTLAIFDKYGSIKTNILQLLQTMCINKFGRKIGAYFINILPAAFALVGLRQSYWHMA